MAFIVRYPENRPVRHIYRHRHTDRHMGPMEELIATMLGGSQHYRPPREYTHPQGTGAAWFDPRFPASWWFQNESDSSDGEEDARLKEELEWLSRCEARRDCHQRAGQASRHCHQGACKMRSLRHRGNRSSPMKTTHKPDRITGQENAEPKFNFAGRKTIVKGMYQRSYKL